MHFKETIYTGRVKQGSAAVHKWIASDTVRDFATGSAGEYDEENLPCIEISCGLAGGSLQSVSSCVFFPGQCVRHIEI